MQISAVLITYNEQENIADALRSVSWADETLVVDSESTDETLNIAVSLGAKVITRPWPGFSAQKQFAVDAAANDWVFSLDADERVSDELAAAVERLRSTGPRADGYSIARLPFYMGRAIRHGGWYPDAQVRLFDRRKARWKDTIIHESVEMSHGAAVEPLDGDILHFTVRSAAEHHKMIGERYAPLGAEQMLAAGRTTSRAKAVSAAAGAFAKTYVIKLGFLDGFPGFCIAWFAAHHAFMKHVLLIELTERGSDAKSTKPA